MDSNSPHFEAFKEPKTFIKVLQVVLTIIAFALTTSFSSHTSFIVPCNGTDLEYKINYSYPYKINNNNIPKVCNQTNTKNTVYGDYTSQSQFFVFVGVVTMLYCIGAVIFYVCFSTMMYENERLPKIDLIATGIIAALWFIASIAWAYGVTHLKEYTNPEYCIRNIIYCDLKHTCKAGFLGGYGSLNASLIAGFANIALWGANLWFVFKDTLWYERRNPDDQMMGSDSADGGNM